MKITRPLLCSVALLFPLFQADAQTPSPRLKPDVPNHSVVLEDADFAIFRAGMRAADSDDWAEVRQAMYQLQDPIAEQVLLWRIAVSDSRAPFSDLDRAIDELQGWPRSSAMRREAEWKIEDSGLSSALIAAWFDDRTPITGEGRVALGRALIDMGRTEEGAEQIRTAWRTQTLRLSNQRDVLRTHGDMFSADDHAARVDFLLWAGQRTAASRLLPELTSGERRVAEARIRLAARSSGVDRAVNAVPASLQDHPGLVYERARWRRRRGLDTQLDLLLELPDSHVHTGALESMWTERKLMILGLIRDGDFDTAYELAAANGMERGVDFADAEFLAGWLALTHLRRAEDALAHFQRLEAGVSTPVSLSRAKYWQGRAAEAAGQLELAADRFTAAAEHSTAYYGQLALVALGPDAARLELAPDPVPTQDELAAFNARPEVQALRLLAELDADYLFRVFMYHFDDRMSSPVEQAMITDIALDYLQIRQAVRAAKAGRLQGVILAERAYPMIDLPDTAPVHTEAALTYSVIRQETEFDPRAISGAGARGLMQMMPATARQTARDLDLPYNFHWLTHDPDYNLTLGMAHLDEVVNQYDGSLVMALAAYNAGGHRVRRWVNNYGDPRTDEIDPIDWVESLPFSETRNYVHRIVENLQVYRARLSSDGSTALNLDQDLAGQFGRDLPALPEDFVAALREAQAAETLAEAEAAAAEAEAAISEADAGADTDQSGSD